MLVENVEDVDFEISNYAQCSAAIGEVQDAVLTPTRESHGRFIKEGFL